MVDILNLKQDYYKELSKLYGSVHKQRHNFQVQNAYGSEDSKSDVKTKLLIIDGRVRGYITYTSSVFSLFKNTVNIREIYIQKPYDTRSNYVALLDSVKRVFIFKGFRYARLSVVQENNDSDISSMLNLKSCKKFFEMKIELGEEKSVESIYDVKFIRFRKGLDEELRANVQNSVFKDTEGHVDCSVDDIICEENQDYFIDDGGVFISLNGKPAGYSQIILEKHPYLKPYIVNFGMVKEFRNMGLGRLLLNYTLNMLKSKGFSEAYVTVDATNISAYTIYRKTGFQKTCTYCDCIYEY